MAVLAIFVGTVYATAMGRIIYVNDDATGANDRPSVFPKAQIVVLSIEVNRLGLLTKLYRFMGIISSIFAP